MMWLGYFNTNIPNKLSRAHCNSNIT